MDCPGDEFLAGSCLSQDERGGTGGGDDADIFAQCIDRRAAPNDAFEVVSSRWVVFRTNGLEPRTHARLGLRLKWDVVFGCARNLCHPAPNKFVHGRRHISYVVAYCLSLSNARFWDEVANCF